MDSINSIARRTENCGGHQACTKPGVEQLTKTGATAQSTAVNMSRSQSSEITLVTAEGDTVTLSASQATEISFETYSSQGQSTGSTAGASAEIRKSSEFSLTVEGDLNRKELKDIRKAIKTLLKAERDLLKGHDVRALERTEKLSDLDQIASIDAKMEFRQTLSVTQTSVETPASEAETSLEPPATETLVVNEDPVAQSETQQQPETIPQSEMPQTTSVPSPVQHFTVAVFDMQQQFTFQYLWDGGRPIAVQGPAVPAVNGIQAVA